MSLWDFALAAWRRPGVEQACLELQEAFGQPPPLLLWRMWALAGRRPVGEAELAAAVSAAKAWQAQVIDPLRQTRRALKAPPPPFAAERCRPLKDQVMAAEVAAERVLLDVLEALSPPPGEREPADPAAALGALCRAWGRPAPAPLLERLAGLL